VLQLLGKEGGVEFEPEDKGWVLELVLELLGGIVMNRWRHSWHFFLGC
jgi:hypothetical protein